MEKEKISEEKMNKLLHERSLVELWCDTHNHFMGFLRTIAAVGNMLLSILIMLKVFGLI